MSNREDTKEIGRAKGRDEEEREASALKDRENTDLPGRAGTGKPPVYGNHEAQPGKERVKPSDENENKDVPAPNGGQMP